MVLKEVCDCRWRSVKGATARREAEAGYRAVETPAGRRELDAAIEDNGRCTWRAEREGVWRARRRDAYVIRGSMAVSEVRM